MFLFFLITYTCILCHCNFGSTVAFSLAVRLAMCTYILTLAFVSWRPIDRLIAPLLRDAYVCVADLLSSVFDMLRFLLPLCIYIPYRRAYAAVKKNHPLGCS